ncbi:type II toxin-antitoxin system Phd/YefM family antitoxin [Lactobacillus sp. ESL0791]|uniref:type II toxin-antitoxin system Phd/YefM family antitoxin n=1 Tax=Lactobacillus sp. ESL0791 TaxID=2983234 RepID=UPI0023F99ED5|nr:type II toxin-antitoxin system Phd/YefM family antitoxin [Lactobacillus sp. ESL0791]MDF7638446.1 type II toxin-antitoxin system Phd/YefM family antitoxin [Lactobacillus sp. ESL0791]
MTNSIKAVTTRELRQNFKKYADEVADFGETVIVTRPENKNVVVISEEEYNSWQETDYFLKSKANRKALKESIAQLDRDDSNNHILTPEEFASLAND